MPSAEEHIHQVQRNQAVLKEALPLPTTPYRCWAVTVMFYTGLHLVERYFAATEDVHYDRHWRREERIRSDRKLQSIYEDYRELYEMSLEARYEVYHFTVDDLTDLKKRLDAIENHVNALLASPS